MGFSLELSGLAVVRTLAALLRVLLSLDLFASSSSSDGSFRPSGPSARAIKERLPVSTYADLLPSCRHAPPVTCAVCLAEMEASDEVRELANCRHVFHRGCLDRWLDHDEQGTCPLCRAPLLRREAPPAPPEEPSWAVDRLLYLFGDDLLISPRSPL